MKVLNRNVQKFFTKYKRTILRFLRDAALPALGAASWGGFVWFARKSAIDAVTAASFAYFLVLSWQNQVMRANKAVTDEENAEKWEGSFASLHEAINKIKVQRTEETLQERETLQTVKGAEGEELEYIGRHPFIAQAYEALQKGLPQPALLMAAVGFEHSVRDVAERAGLNPRRSLAALIRDMAGYLDAHVSEKLQTLTRLRNSLVHGQAGTQIADEQEAAQAVEAFRDGILWLEIYLDEHPGFGRRMVP